jgi:hypothetical protein
MSEVVSVRLAEGRAEVQIGAQTLTVDRRDEAGRVCACPIELITAALGS